MLEPTRVGSLPRGGALPRPQPPQRRPSVLGSRCVADGERSWLRHGDAAPLAAGAGGGAPAGRPPFPTTPARKKFVLAPAAGNCAWLKLQKQEQPQEMQKGQKGQKQTQEQTQTQTQKRPQKPEHTAAAQCRRRTHWLAPAAACGLAVALRLAAAQICDHGLVAGNGIWQPIDYFS
eukprot:COSAG01_NODE_182_length_22838_cov_34.788733_21_plen_176_part_00